MFLFIGESLGWSELLLIGVIALIVLGPRKLPELARTFGKLMADFRKTTDEFKSTWEKEVEKEKDILRPDSWLENPLKLEDNAIKAAASERPAEKVPLPEVKRAERDFSGPAPQPAAKPETTTEENPAENISSSKRDWL